MAIAISVKKQSKLGTLHANIADITLDNAYPTGGYAISPAVIGMDSIDVMVISASVGYLFDYDHVNGKLKVFVTGALNAALNQVANGTNLSTVSLRVAVIGC